MVSGVIIVVFAFAIIILLLWLFARYQRRKSRAHPTPGHCSHNDPSCEHGLMKRVWDRMFIGERAELDVETGDVGSMYNDTTGDARKKGGDACSYHKGSQDTLCHLRKKTRIPKRIWDRILFGRTLTSNTIAEDGHVHGVDSSTAEFGPRSWSLSPLGQNVERESPMKDGIERTKSESRRMNKRASRRTIIAELDGNEILRPLSNTPSSTEELLPPPPPKSGQAFATTSITSLPVNMEPRAHILASSKSGIVTEQTERVVNTHTLARSQSLDVGSRLSGHNPATRMSAMSDRKSGIVVEYTKATVIKGKDAANIVVIGRKRSEEEIVAVAAHRDLQPIPTAEEHEVGLQQDAEESESRMERRRRRGMMEDELETKPEKPSSRSRSLERDDSKKRREGERSLSFHGRPTNRRKSIAIVLGRTC